MANFINLSIVSLVLLISCNTLKKDPDSTAFGTTQTGTRSSKPNFVIILTDDQGYQDVGCFGSPNIKTPNLDKMAAEGMKFTSFYAQTICGPSRASLMTGCYPNRVATMTNRSVEEEHHPRMHDQEITIAEVLREVGYTTGAFGKWDLAGHTQTDYETALLPTRQGFDFFFGTPTSNDAFVHLMRGEEIVERNADLSTITRRFTDETIGFIKNNKDKPFFAYLAHSMPHISLAASKQFAGKSQRGLYGDVIEELDWNVGRLLKAIKDLGLDESTYVMFMSDNGPWYLLGDLGPYGGSAAPLRGAKTSAWEGGMRVPGIMRAPGRIPAGVVCDEVVSTLDLLPTLAGLGGGSVPNDRIIDGHDISKLIHGEEVKGPTKVFYYYQRTRLRAVRAGKWKLHLVNRADKEWGLTHARESDHIHIDHPMLFDLENDIDEQHDVADKHSEVVAELLKYARQGRGGMRQRVFNQ
jgi:arylsulfatase A-like enzyme